ncbi:hypothetical protein [Pistricoccus aurantiacus]|uniref:hypothetical protein n=1 Tax=Pistricoccus aurantiacus TaxID=1883414 RepID=UPI00363C1360
MRPVFHQPATQQRSGARRSGVRRGATRREVQPSSDAWLNRLLDIMTITALVVGGIALVTRLL